MKILQVINNLGSGGAEKLVTNFIPFLQDSGHKVDLLLLQKKGNVFHEDIAKTGTEIIVFSENKLFSFKFFILVKDLIKSRKYDIVHVHLFPSFYYIGILKFLRLISVKIIYTRHYTKSKRTSNIILKKIDEFIYNRYDKIIAITKSVAEEIFLEKKIPESKVTIINNAINFNEFKIKKEHNLKNVFGSYEKSNKIITMVGRFSETKDHETLIKAMSYLPNEVHLLLIGEGHLLDKSKKTSSILGLNDRIHFLGFRKDIAEILNSSNIGILSSKREGMPISVLEILASQIPFVGSNVPGIKDIFENYDSSTILFEYGNIIELSNLLKDILNNENIKKTNIEIGNQIINKYSIDKMVEKHIELYLSLI